MIAGIVLAAGASRRFGGVKQLAELDGRSLLERAITAMSAVGELTDVVVVLGANAQVIMRTTPMRRARVVICREWAEGESASLRAGLAAVAGADAAVITLADEPLIGAEAIRRVVAHRDSTAARAVRASYGGVPGRPVLLEQALFPVAAGLQGDTGACALVSDGDDAMVPCDDIASPVDIDTPEELHVLRSSGQLL